ncbi:MAG: DUF1684 domain-containing protein [Gemmatimonadales bacterium]
MAWLQTAPNSPFAAVAQQPIGAGLRLGPPDADFPLEGLSEHRLTAGGGRVTLDGPDGRRVVPPLRPVALGRYTLVVDGAGGVPVATVFGRSRVARPVEYYPLDGNAAFTGPLLPPERRGTVRILAPDGIEIEAIEAGSVLVPMGSRLTRLRVRRIPTGGEESELEIYFRDETNGSGTYPAGRFVNLVPAGKGRYRLDFNRARNPFCAYSSAYACPAPWQGNTLPAKVEAGEKYGPSPAGSWRAALDLAGGELRFGLVVERTGEKWQGRLCNGTLCHQLSAVKVSGDSVVFEIADYAATIGASTRGDSLAGTYRNIGNRGPRTIPFHATRGRWPVSSGPSTLIGRWDATFFQEMGTSPRVIEMRNGRSGLEGTLISNTGDYGHFAGAVKGDSFALSHFDGSFVYLMTGALRGDTLRGVFHAGIRTETPFEAVRSTGAPHLKSPTEVTGADTTTPFHFSAPDLDGRIVSERDPRFKGKVVLVDIFGSWCPTCHDAAPVLVRLYRRYHSRGFEIVGLAYEVTGVTAVDERQVRRYRDKFSIPFPLLLAGINDVEAAGATLPQLRGFTSFPTTVFLGRDGKVRQVHAGFYGPATGAQHQRLIEEFEREIEKLIEAR